MTCDCIRFERLLGLKYALVGVIFTDVEGYLVCALKNGILNILTLSCQQKLYKHSCRSLQKHRQNQTVVITLGVRFVDTEEGSFMDLVRPYPHGYWPSWETQSVKVIVCVFVCECLCVCVCLCVCMCVYFSAAQADHYRGCVTQEQIH